MSESVKIDLSTPIIGAKGPVAQLALREPKYADVMALGDPTAFAHGTNGMVYSADKDDVIKAYIERLLVTDNGADPLLLNQLNLTDTLRLRDAIQGFFADARRAIYSPPATSSSSSPALSV